ncbi:hypothetical protein F5B20DRAFT_580276 [Whalleya microplaca]|nr:hypothetical protein F5B20DRAFT_580276 [Whalleya microplaca]
MTRAEAPKDEEEANTDVESVEGYESDDSSVIFILDYPPDRAQAADIMATTAKASSDDTRTSITDKGSSTVKHIGAATYPMSHEDGAPSTIYGSSFQSPKTDSTLCRESVLRSHSTTTDADVLGSPVSSAVLSSRQSAPPHIWREESDNKKARPTIPPNVWSDMVEQDLVVEEDKINSGRHKFPVATPPVPLGGTAKKTSDKAQEKPDKLTKPLWSQIVAGKATVEDRQPSPLASPEGRQSYASASVSSTATTVAAATGQLNAGETTSMPAHTQPPATRLWSQVAASRPPATYKSKVPSDALSDRHHKHDDRLTGGLLVRFHSTHDTDVQGDARGRGAFSSRVELQEEAPPLHSINGWKKSSKAVAPDSIEDSVDVDIAASPTRNEHSTQNERRTQSDSPSEREPSITGEAPTRSHPPTQGGLPPRDEPLRRSERTTRSNRPVTIVIEDSDDEMDKDPEEYFRCHLCNAQKNTEKALKEHIRTKHINHTIEATGSIEDPVDGVFDRPRGESPMQSESPTQGTWISTKPGAA